MHIYNADMYKSDGIACQTQDSKFERQRFEVEYSIPPGHERIKQ